MEKRERFLSHVLQSFADYGVLLILEDSVYRKEKGARNISWRLAGTSTTWVQEKARRVLRIRDETREEFVLAKPATYLLEEKTLIMTSPKLGSTPRGTIPYPKTYPPQGGNGRHSAEQSGTLESRV